MSSDIDQLLEKYRFLLCNQSLSVSIFDESLFSRFGKFVEIQFDCTGRISGAAIRTYLLERSRVVNITKSERNYHCFYQLCASSEDAIKYKLTDPKDFFYLNQSTCFTLPGVDERNEYFRTRRAMDIVEISSSEQDAIFKTLAAILHLGNVEFVTGKEHDSSALKDETSLAHLKNSAELLMCDHNALKKALCTRVILTGGESITKVLDPEAALINRDTLAKTIYSRLFDWYHFHLESPQSSLTCLTVSIAMNFFCRKFAS